MRLFPRPWRWLVPALLVASGLALVAVALTWSGPSIDADRLAPRPTATTSSLTGQPSAPPSATIINPPSAAAPSPRPLASSTPSAALPASTASTSPAEPPDALASRIRIDSLNVDLPVVSGTLVVPGNRDFYPLCDVAMYLDGFGAPGVPGTTYLYAHAQQGMFLPLLRASEVTDGAAMVGATVEVFSANGKVHVYEVVRVKRHATDMSIAEVEPGQHQLVLQTSEGPTGTIPKLQIAARPVSVADVPLDQANPMARPRVCLPG